MRGRLLRLRIGRATLHAEVMTRGSIAWAGETGYTDASELADAIARLAAEPPQRCQRLAVAIEHPPVQLRTVAGLPPVKPSHLRALVAQQAGRFFRRNGHPLVTDAAWLGKGAPGVARAVAIEEPLVEAVAMGARAAGLWLEGIAPSDESAGLSLLPPSERESRERAARRRTRKLALVTSGVWLVALAAFFARLAVDRHAVERDLASVERPLAAVLAARRELRDAETTVNAIRAAEGQRGRALAALAGVAQALPDSSVMTSFAWRADGSGVLLGAARQAADVVARLDRLGSLADVRLGGPVVRQAIAGREWEQFSILFGGRRDEL